MIPPATEETIIVCVPVGVVERVLIVSVVVQVGEQVVGEKDPVAPVGRPITENDADWVVPEDRVVVTVLVTDCPLVTDTLPLFEIV